MTPVRSLAELRRLCEAGDDRYRKLAVAAAVNLGQPAGSGPDGWRVALRSLSDCALSLEVEYHDADGEQLVIDEMNFARDMLDPDLLAALPDATPGAGREQ
jgi:hypothetical protein